MELPIHWKLHDLTPAQMATLDDELIARLKAKEAYERQFAAECARADAHQGDGDAEAAHSERVLDAAFAEPRRPPWDCESVLSMRSNMSHQPGRIGDEGGQRRPRRRRDNAAAAPHARAIVELSAKSGLPLGVPGVIARTALTLAAADSADAGSSASDADTQEGAEALNLGVARTRDEKVEDKKARKAAVKASKREARAAKKQLKGVYSKERTRAQHLSATNQAAQASIVPIA
jgi:protein LTV1